jgi:hypothetical protein
MFEPVSMLTLSQLQQAEMTRLFPIHEITNLVWSVRHPPWSMEMVSPQGWKFRILHQQSYNYRCQLLIEDNDPLLSFTWVAEFANVTTRDHMVLKSISSQEGLETDGLYDLSFLSQNWRTILITVLITNTSQPISDSLLQVHKIPSANAITFNVEDVSNIAFVFRGRNPLCGKRYLYARKQVLCHYSSYFVDMFKFSESTSGNLPTSSAQILVDRKLDFPQDESDADSDCDFEDFEDEAEPPARVTQVPIGGTEYRTWQALLFYLETGVIFFAPLKSSYSLGVDKEDSESWRAYAHRKRVSYYSIEGNFPFECSPKSMYALADMIGLEELKEMAFRQIIASLNNTNILHEVATNFAFKYEKVRAAELEYLSRSWPTIRKDESLLNTFLSPVRVEGMDDRWEQLLIKLLGL